ncbi:MAG: hypothetical protein PHW73_14730 [Atribacterota bacterium]|nr:hypothetical protein [Atribacterota bacterium]
MNTREIQKRADNLGVLALMIGELEEKGYKIDITSKGYKRYVKKLYTQVLNEKYKEESKIKNNWKTKLKGVLLENITEQDFNTLKELALLWDLYPEAPEHYHELHPEKT